jgi:hypothetical protein
MGSGPAGAGRTGRCRSLCSIPAAGPACAVGRLGVPRGILGRGGLSLRLEGVLIWVCIELLRMTRCKGGEEGLVWCLCYESVVRVIMGERIDDLGPRGCESMSDASELFYSFQHLV